MVVVVTPLAGDAEQEEEVVQAWAAFADGEAPARDAVCAVLQAVDGRLG